ncbi:MAG: GNAT family N-acetyltransferase [Pyrinomonadaceae bacterium]
MPHRVRQVEPAHIGELIRIADETNLSAWSAQNYLDEFKNKFSLMFRLEAETNGTIGFIVGRTVPGMENGLDAEIYNIAITVDHQMRGNGQLLLDAFIVECADQYVGNIWLEVRESNCKALKFYQNNGFLRIQTRSHFYENPREHAILMKLDLACLSRPPLAPKSKT